MDIWHLLLDIVILLAIALTLGVLFERLKQSAILGYLAAGALLGPGALNLVSNRPAVSAMAEVGVALLLFTIGLEFSWRRLRRLGAIALGGGTIQVVLTALLAAIAARAIGLDSSAAIAVGAIVAPSSTACVLRMLTDRAELESIYGRNSLGILLLQDVALVPLILLVSMLGSGGSAGAILWGIGRAVVLSILFVGGYYFFSTYVFPKLIDVTVTSRNRELPILFAVVICLGGAWAAHALSLSPTLGAFIAGFLLAESPYATQIRADVSSLRTLFVALFFTSIGMLADLTFIRSEWRMVACVVAAIIVGKALVVWPIARIFGSLHRHALATGICLAQVGEFSFVLAQIALSDGVLDDHIFRLIVSATVATLFLTPYLVTVAPVSGEWVEERLVGLGIVSAPMQAPSATSGKLAGHVIIVGFGPAGQRVTEALRAAEIPTVVVELNPRAVALAKRHGVHAEVGDASQEQILEHVQVASARAVVVTVPDHRTALQVISQVRALAPHGKVIARARYHLYAKDLEQAGAHVIIDEEQQVGSLLGLEVIKHIKGAKGTALEETFRLL